MLPPSHRVPNPYRVHTPTQRDTNDSIWSTYVSWANRIKKPKNLRANPSVYFPGLQWRRAWRATTTREKNQTIMRDPSHARGFSCEPINRSTHHPVSEKKFLLLLLFPRKRNGITPTFNMVTQVSSGSSTTSELSRFKPSKRHRYDSKCSNVLITHIT